MKPALATAIVATFKHVDDLLDRVSRVANAEVTPFSSERVDLSPHESRMMQSLVSQLRERMLEALDRLDVPVPQPTISSRWSILTALTFAEIALSEISTSSLRGYGGISPALGAEVEGVMSEIRSLVGRGRELLDLQHRTDFERWLEAAPAPVTEVLRELKRLADAHGLFELHAQIEAIAERASAPAADVGVFGRVSAGKSSLINRLVGEPVLPVDATPATAVPLRIFRGDPRVRVKFQNGTVEDLPLEAVKALASERENPSNRRGVSGLEVLAATVPPGVRFIDTPGVASRITPTTAAAFEWLPRCDLGLVLVAAGTAVDREDLALVRGLEAAGVEYRILLTKCDLLTAEEEVTTLAYLREQFGDSTGNARPVSVAPGAERGLDWLLTELLQPLAADRAADVGPRVGLRLQHLITITEAALEGRRPWLDQAMSGRNQIGQVEAEVRERTRRTAGSAAELLEDAVPAVVDAWREGRDAREVVRDEVVRYATETLADVRRRVADALSGGGTAPPDSMLPPIPDLASLDGLPVVTPPGVLWGPLARSVARRRLAGCRRVVESSLTTYAVRLERWTEVMLSAAIPGEAEPNGSAPAPLNRLRRLADAVACSTPV